MQITFDTTTITDDEVRGIFALLDTVRSKSPAVGEPAWTGVQITKRADTGEEISRDKGWVAGPSETVVKLAEETVEVAPDTDANGLPWDERIHSGTKALNADGTWRTKRGVDKALVASVEAELRNQTVGLKAEDASITINTETGETVLSAEQVVVAPPAPPAPPAPVETPLVADGTYVEVGGAAPEAPSSPFPPPAAATSPFVSLMKRVTTAQGAGKLTAQRVKELLESLDKKSIMDLRTDTDALDAFAVLLDGEGV